MSLSIGCISEDESLTEVRLSLLDHQNWEKADQDTGNQNNMEEWGNATEEISGLKIKNIMGFTALDANGKKIFKFRYSCNNIRYSKLLV